VSATGIAISTRKDRLVASRIRVIRDVVGGVEASASHVRTRRRFRKDFAVF
jgi:hypothetical protein